MSMTSEARVALALRLAGAKASVKKLPKILEQLSPDDRLRHQYAFYKAHTGRWAGRGAQLQNMKAARTKEEKALVSAVIRLLEEGKDVPDLDALSLALRPMLTAPAGKKIVLADKKSVENRVLAWAAGCDTMAKVYAEGKDPYIDFASRMSDCDYKDVTAEMRQQAKPGTLGAGFGMGGGRLIRKCKCSCKATWNVSADEKGSVQCPTCKAEVKPGLPVKTGLWRYAEMMGIDLSQAQAQSQVDAFRETFSDVATYWYWLEAAFRSCCLKRRDQTIESSLGCKVVFRYRDPALRILLPSGRELVYPSAYAKEERTRYGSKLVLGFEGVRAHSWGYQSTYGGRLCENVVQAIARDCLAEDMFNTEKDAGLEIVGHTHDELICLADEHDETAQSRLVAIMSITPPWAPGLILGADGHEGKRYEKS